MPLPLYTSNGKFPLGGLRAIDGSHHVCQAGSLSAAQCVAGDSRPFKRESRVTFNLTHKAKARSTKEPL